MVGGSRYFRRTSRLGKNPNACPNAVCPEHNSIISPNLNDNCPCLPRTNSPKDKCRSPLHDLALNSLSKPEFQVKKASFKLIRTYLLLTYIMPTCHAPQFYIVKLGFTGVFIFIIIIALKHRSLVTCTHNLCFMQKYEYNKKNQLKIVIFTAVKYIAEYCMGVFA